MIKVQEGKQVGTLYHYTSIVNLLKILKTNTVSSGGFIGEGNAYNSFTRDQNFHRQARILETEIEARLVVDGDSLSERYKIEPYSDASFLNSDEDLSSCYKDLEAEERIEGDVKDIRKYLIRVDILRSSLDSDFKRYRAWNRIQIHLPLHRSFTWKDLEFEHIQRFIERTYGIACNILEDKKVPK